VIVGKGWLDCISGCWCFWIPNVCVGQC